MTTDNTPSQSMPLWLAFLPILLLIGLLSWNVFIFGDDALGGSSQIIIIIVTGIAAAIGLSKGVAWEKQQKSIIDTISSAMPSILILLLVGALSSIWLLCGTVPLLVIIGLKTLNPIIFLPACCVACALTSIVSGSSWSTAATIGVAMVGVGRALGIDDGMIGGAIISGSYFGDKISPLSDTTNLAAGVTGTPLFEHIRYLLFTTGPSIIISLIAFTVLGFIEGTSQASADMTNIVSVIEQKFTISYWLLIPPIVTLGLIIKKVNAIPALFVGTILGVLCALIFQQALIQELIQKLLQELTQKGNIEQYKIERFADNGAYAIVMIALFGEANIITSNALLNELFISNGMFGMLGTIWLIIAAMSFGGVLQACGMLQRIMESIKHFANSFFSLVACTTGTCLITNVSTSDQYISVAIPGKMYADLYKEKGYASQNLSRTLEDTGTVTSVLIPWNTCGAYHASVLTITTFAYLPYCFFNIISPIMTLLFAWFMIKIAKQEPSVKQHVA